LEKSGQLQAPAALLPGKEPAIPSGYEVITLVSNVLFLITLGGNFLRSADIASNMAHGRHPHSIVWLLPSDFHVLTHQSAKGFDPFRLLVITSSYYFFSLSFRLQIRGIAVILPSKSDVILWLSGVSLLSDTLFLFIKIYIEALITSNCGGADVRPVWYLECLKTQHLAGDCSKAHPQHLRDSQLPFQEIFHFSVLEMTSRIYL
jgi:hypothetical protein